MKKLEMNEMEELQGGGAFDCLMAFFAANDAISDWLGDRNSQYKRGKMGVAMLAELYACN